VSKVRPILQILVVDISHANAILVIYKMSNIKFILKSIRDENTLFPSFYLIIEVDKCIIFQHKVFNYLTIQIIYKMSNRKFILKSIVDKNTLSPSFPSLWKLPTFLHENVVVSTVEF